MKKLILVPIILILTSCSDLDHLTGVKTKPCFTKTDTMYVTNGMEVLSIHKDCELK